jgi:hypothetical protein
MHMPPKQERFLPNKNTEAQDALKESLQQAGEQLKNEKPLLGEKNDTQEAQAKWAKEMKAEFEKGRIQELRQEIGKDLGATPEELEKIKTKPREIDPAEVYASEQNVREIGRQLEEKSKAEKLRRELPPNEQAASFWEDMADKKKKDMEMFKERLAMDEASFNTTFGELAPAIRESLPGMIEKNQRMIDEFENAARVLREKGNAS